MLHGLLFDEANVYQSFDIKKYLYNFNIFILKIFIHLHQFVDVLLKSIWTRVRVPPTPQMGVKLKLVRRQTVNLLIRMDRGFESLGSHSLG